uniref:Uncharacterized protein n=1 Tax=Sphaerodactylus townsendi TaxID=933632 RepID=A0ACB8FP44_9SAUR
MEPSHSHLLEAACPPSPELLECSEPLEPPTPPPLVRGKRGQRRGAAGSTSATVLTHSQLKELARPPSPELLTCSQPLEQAAPAPPVQGKRGPRRGAAGPTAATVLTHSQLKELAQPPSAELFTCSKPPEQAAPAPPVRGKRGQRRGVAGPTSAAALTRSQLKEPARPPSPELFTCSQPLELAAPAPPRSRQARPQEGTSWEGFIHSGKRGPRRGPAGKASSTLVTHSQMEEDARAPSPALFSCSQPLELAAPAPPVRGKRGQRRGPAGRASSTLVTHSQMEEDAWAPSPELLICSQALELATLHPCEAGWASGGVHQEAFMHSGHPQTAAGDISHTFS